MNCLKKLVSQARVSSVTKKFLPITVVIATLNRPAILQRTLASLAEQDALPTQIVIIDGSAGDDTQVAVGEATFSAGCSLTWQRATHLGAAAQRNQGVKLATQPYIWFCDDDIVLEPECLARLWQAINSDSTFGGVNAMITNQRYNAPGRVTRTLYRLLDGKSRDCYAGKCIGPALNILPQDDPN
jgi:glycosyltransferase involved in cell wall biosynthesis